MRSSVAKNPDTNRSETDRLARENAPRFREWQASPAGLSAQGFGKIGPVKGQAEAKAALKAAQR